MSVAAVGVINSLDVASINPKVGGCYLLWSVFLLWIREVIIDTSAECFMKTCAPVLWPVLDQPYQDRKSGSKDNENNYKYCPYRIVSFHCPGIGAITTVWILRKRKNA